MKTKLRNVNVNGTDWTTRASTTWAATLVVDAITLALAEQTITPERARNLLAMTWTEQDARVAWHLALSGGRAVGLQATTFDVMDRCHLRGGHHARRVETALARFRAGTALTVNGRVANTYTL